MILERDNNIILLGVIFLFAIVIANSFFIYTLSEKTNTNYILLNQKIDTNQLDNQDKINELSTNIIQLKDKVGSLDTSLDELKASTSADFSGIIENSVKSIVTIRTDVAQGTGFIITNNGYVITNAHVLAGGHNIQALTSNQEEINAKYIGYDSNLDVALLKIPGDYTPLMLGNSNNIQIGEKVIAIGNPLGLQFSASEGIVSAVHRTGSNNLPAYIQTDAALNPGNSGGPLINTEGEAIGMNNFKIGEGENLGFAIESNYIKDSVNRISRLTLNQTLLA
ncbi:MAG: trypsin-like peptidase domain-containing protein [Nanoarchaeota archaeon]|nr:trypsin-like peptidase domain-containing protein [Nanoarchaeota archaeon]